MLKQASVAIIALLGMPDAAMAQAAAAPTPPAQTAPACTLPKIVDTAPLEQLPGSDLATVPVVIDGKARQFLLDIGLNKPTEVSAAAMSELGLPQDPKRTELVQFGHGQGPLLPQYSGIQVPVYDVRDNLGVAGRDTRVRVGSFGIGDATDHNRQMLVAKKGEIAQGAPYAGFLTGDFFRQYDVELDFGGGQITWLTPTQCTDPDQVVFWAHSEVAIVPVTLANDGRLQMQASVGGHLINAEIDTHSAQTVMRRDIAELYVGLKADKDMAPAGGLRDGMNMQIYVHIFPQIIFAGGGITALNVPVLIQDYSMRPILDREQGVRSALGAWNAADRIPDLVIGMDVLKHLHMYVVPGQGRVYVTAAG